MQYKYAYEKIAYKHTEKTIKIWDAKYGKPEWNMPFSRKLPKLILESKLYW